METKIKYQLKKENKQISNFFNAQNFKDFEKIMEDFEKNRKKS